MEDDARKQARSIRRKLCKAAKHEAGHLLLNWLLGNRPCGAFILDNGEAFTMSERVNDTLVAIGLLKVAGFVAGCEKRNLRSIRANWNRPQKFARENDCFWVTSAAQHVLDNLGDNLGWLFVEAVIRTVEEACQTYSQELEELSDILKMNGYIKYPEAETLFSAMDQKYKIKCPDWIVDRCFDYVEIVAKEHMELLG